MNNIKRNVLSHKIASLSGEIVSKKGYVSTIDLFLALGWLTPDKLTAWKRGKVPYLEQIVTANLNKISRTMKEFKSWAIHSNLKASPTFYKHKNFVLRFSKNGELNIENAYSTHYVLIKSQPLTRRASLP